MDAESDLCLRERTFGHCIVTWIVKKYGQSLWQKNFKTSTPEFCIKGPGLQVTKWKLSLQCNFDYNSLIEKFNTNIQSKPKEAYVSCISKELEQKNFHLNIDVSDKEKIDFSPYDKNNPAYPMYPVKHITLRLERIESEEGPSDIWVNWKAYCVSMNGEKFLLSQNECFYYKDQTQGFNIGTMRGLEKDFEHNFGEMTILCDMVVKDLYTDNYSDDKVCIDMRRLSKDFQWIFNQKRSCDAEIRVNGQSMMVHKAILCSHSSYFDDLFKNENSSVIEVPGMSYIEMTNILEYIYTCDFKKVIDQPSVCIYEAAILMNLENLAAHYIPEEYKICTVLDIKKLTFLWTIKDFATEEINCRSSPLFTNDMGDSAWQIHLYPKGVDCKSEYIEIAIECAVGGFDGDLSVQCAVLNNGRLSFWKTLSKAEGVNIFEEKKFISREDLAKLLYNDSLTLGVKISKGKESSIVHKPCTPILLSMKKSLDDMSKNMLSLLHSKKHADVILETAEEEIKAHSYILSARSYLLSKLLKENTYLILYNVSPKIFNLLLDYMYSAVLSVSDIETIIEVYEAAEQFIIPCLQSRCFTILQNNVTVKEVSNIVKLAHKYNNRYLKEAVLEFLNLNENKFTEETFEELKYKSSLSFGDGQISEDLCDEKKSLESVDKEIKCNEKLVEGHELVVSSISSCTKNEALEKHLKSLIFLDFSAKKSFPSKELVKYPPGPSSDGMNNSMQGIASQMLFLNAIKNEQISFTCKSSSKTKLITEEIVLNEN